METHWFMMPEAWRKCNREGLPQSENRSQGLDVAAIVNCSSFERCRATVSKSNALSSESEYPAYRLALTTFPGWSGAKSESSSNTLEVKTGTLREIKCLHCFKAGTRLREKQNCPS